MNKISNYLEITKNIACIIAFTLISIFCIIKMTNNTPINSYKKGSFHFKNVTNKITGYIKFTNSGILFKGKNTGKTAYMFKNSSIKSIEIED